MRERTREEIEGKEGGGGDLDMILDPDYKCNQQVAE